VATVQRQPRLGYWSPMTEILRGEDRSSGEHPLPCRILLHSFLRRISRLTQRCELSIYSRRMLLGIFRIAFMLAVADRYAWRRLSRLCGSSFTAEFTIIPKDDMLPCAPAGSIPRILALDYLGTGRCLVSINALLVPLTDDWTNVSGAVSGWAATSLYIIAQICLALFSPRGCRSRKLWKDLLYSKAFSPSFETGRRNPFDGAHHPSDQLNFPRSFLHLRAMPYLTSLPPLTCLDFQ
jgi:hypothetical protein